MRDMFNRNLINQIKRSTTAENPDILQIRYGSGLYSGLLRKAFPAGSITLIDRNPEIRSLISEDFFKDILVSNYKEEVVRDLNSQFDLITLGSNQNLNLFSTKFKIYNIEEFESLIHTIDYYLKPKGEIVILTRSDRFENKSQKNFIKSLYLTQSYDDESKILQPILNEQKITQTFTDKLKKLGKYLVKAEYIKKDPLIRAPLYCRDFIERNGYYPTSEIMEKALKIDAESKKYGQENGYLLFLRAKKNI
ncbi:MAG: hypothetical protein ACOCWO_00840 [Candidatus Muiribacteriaceae bacterium]